MRERRRDYELVFIISPLHTNDDEVAAIIQRVQNTIEAEGGMLTSIQHSPPWGRRKLAYPIRAYAGGEASRRNFNEGFYVLLHFTVAASKIMELERTLKLTDTILRYLVTVVERKGAAVQLPDEAEATAAADDLAVVGVESDEYDDDNLYTGEE